MEKELNLNAQQLEYLPIALIEPDPDNFYSLEGLNALADSISMQGLQNPILVRPVGKMYRIISGHRRHAAILLLIDSGEEQWRGRVPCLVDRREMSDAYWQLMLISANSTSRVLTSAEQSRQAERTKELLYQLKEEGFAFPGRMDQHVSEATGIAVAKLKRLSAIRNNLQPALLKLYDEEKLNEDTAYNLQKLPADVQIAIGWECEAREEKKRSVQVPVAGSVKEVLRRLEQYQASMPCRAHAGGPECHHHIGKIVRSCFEPYSWNVCPEDKCCMDCRTGCSVMCAEAKSRRQLEQAVEKEKIAEREKAAEAEAETRRQKIVRWAKKMLPLVEAKGATGKLFDYFTAPTAEQVRKWATGDTKDDTFYGSDFIYPNNAANIRLMCSRLGCTPEFALGMSDEPFRKEEAKEAPKAEPVKETTAAPKWQKDQERQKAAEARPAPIPEGFTQTGLLFDRVQRIRRAAEASGADLRHVFSMRSLSERDLETYLSIINGGPDPTLELDDLFDDTEELADLADDLECSTDFLLGRTEDPQINEGGDQKAGTWQTGDTPDEAGWYAVWSTWDPKWPPEHGVYYFDGARWKGIGTCEKIHAFYPIPGNLDSEEVEA